MPPIISAVAISLALVAGLGHAETTTQEDVSDFAMNRLSPETKWRTELFTSIAQRYGYEVLNGRFGGEYNNDQLAMKRDSDRTILLLGLKVTGAKGDIQLDPMSLGPFMQFSDDWLSALVAVLKIDREQYITAFQIEVARNTKKLDLRVLWSTEPRRKRNSCQFPSQSDA